MILDKKIFAINKIKEFYPITNLEIDNLDKFVELLLDYNKNFNLISNSTIDDIWIRHILDSAQLLKYIDNKNLKLGDFGSGAGFPGVILSILGVKDTFLIEKSFRKCQFLKLVQKSLNINITVIQKKIQEIQHITFDTITARALAPLNKLMQILSPFSTVNSRYLFLRGRKIKEELIVFNNANYQYNLYDSITADDSKIIIISKRLNLY